MPNIQTYNVIPNLPPSSEVAARRSFSISGGRGSQSRAPSCFRHLDPELWDRTNHNPAAHAPALAPGAAASRWLKDEVFLRELAEVLRGLHRNILAGRIPTGSEARVSEIKKPIAYFSAEFGFHESIPNYSGGLGILAGDHCKSASDLDLNFVASRTALSPRLFQAADRQGWLAGSDQSEPELSIICRSAKSMRNDQILLVSVPLLGREVFAKIWELRVGRINLYLLDTDIAENRAEDRLITAELIRRRSRDADAPGDRSRDRRREGAERARLSRRKSFT